MIDAFDVSAFINVVLLIVICVIFFVISGALGWKILKWIKTPGLTILEKIIYALSLGLGIIAYGIFILGLLGLFKTYYIWGWILVSLIIARKEFFEIIGSLKPVSKIVTLKLKKSSARKKTFLAFCGLIFGMTLLQAITPTWDYDGLMYHLEGPRQFLSTGQIDIVPDIFQANGPMLVEMLFAFGLSMRLASFARVIHLVFAVLLFLATYTLGRRYFGKKVGWLSVAVLIGIPFLPWVASFAYVDFAWAVFVLLSLYSFLLWLEDGHMSWIVFSGILGGFALGIKYFAVANIAVIGILLIWYSRKQGLRATLMNITVFGGVCAVLGCLWYLKNWDWEGGSVYSLAFGGSGWSSEYIQRCTMYTRQGFGTGHRLLDYLFLPINIYLHPDKFATLTRIEKVSPIYLLLFAYPFIRHSKITNIIAVVSLLWFFFWALGPQQVRFLLPLLPGLSILLSCILIQIVHKIPWRILKRALTPAIMGSMVLITLIYTLDYFLVIQPWRYVIGIESEQAFLYRMEGNYRALNALENMNVENPKIFMLWDGRSYYCNGNCIPDTCNILWTGLVLDYKENTRMAKYLADKKVTHLLLNVANTEFMFAHDPSGDQKKSATFFVQEFLPACAHEVYRDREVRLYEFTCNDAQ